MPGFLLVQDRAGYPLTHHTPADTLDFAREVDLALAAATEIIFVVDAREGLTPLDQIVARLLRKSHLPVFVAANKVDISMAFVGPFIVQLDANVPIVLLGGIHVGCYELFGTERVRTIRPYPRPR